jgi:hypothetical protein
MVVERDIADDGRRIIIECGSSKAAWAIIVNHYCMMRAAGGQQVAATRTRYRTLSRTSHASRTACPPPLHMRAYKDAGGRRKALCFSSGSFVAGAIHEGVSDASCCEMYDVSVDARRRAVAVTLAEPDSAWQDANEIIGTIPTDTGKVLVDPLRRRLFTGTRVIDEKTDTVIATIPGGLQALDPIHGKIYFTNITSSGATVLTVLDENTYKTTATITLDNGSLLLNRFVVDPLHEKIIYGIEAGANSYAGVVDLRTNELIAKYAVPDDVSHQPFHALCPLPGHTLYEAFEVKHYFTAFSTSLPSSQFLCSTWNPVSSPRPTHRGGRRAQGGCQGRPSR